MIYDAVSASDIFAPGNEVGPFIWKDFLPAALKSQTIVPAPEALIVGEQLRSVQLGLDTQKKGVGRQRTKGRDIVHLIDGAAGNIMRTVS